MVICIVVGDQLQTKTYKVSQFMTQVFGRHFCYQAGRCESAPSVSCVEAG